MRKIIIVLALLFAGLAILSYTQMNQPIKHITKQQAYTIANDLFNDYKLKRGNYQDDLGKPTVVPSGEGWEFTYQVRSDPSRRLGIFVNRNGTADYSEAP